MSRSLGVAKANELDLAKLPVAYKAAGLTPVVLDLRPEAGGVGGQPQGQRVEIQASVPEQRQEGYLASGDQVTTAAAALVALVQLVKVILETRQVTSLPEGELIHNKWH
ncbi:PH domain-containing protein [Babesia caballi]|uniref:PH domain-containing protein n=1 Tax=Babesia caballi TaxID=5871 RepID=A0AAV4M308_BABCB|nr:PH domain-containing protein [Babesia caballi]